MSLGFIVQKSNKNRCNNLFQAGLNVQNKSCVWNTAPSYTLPLDSPKRKNFEFLFALPDKIKVLNF